MQRSFYSIFIIPFWKKQACQCKTELSFGFNLFLSFQLFSTIRTFFFMFSRSNLLPSHPTCLILPAAIRLFILQCLHSSFCYLPYVVSSLLVILVPITSEELVPLRHVFSLVLPTQQVFAFQTWFMRYPNGSSKHCTHLLVMTQGYPTLGKFMIPSKAFLDGQRRPFLLFHLQPNVCKYKNTKLDTWLERQVLRGKLSRCSSGNHEGLIQMKSVQML